MNSAAEGILTPSRPILFSCHRTLPSNSKVTAGLRIDRQITYDPLANEVALFMHSMKLKKADVLVYSMGACTRLPLCIRYSGHDKLFDPITGVVPIGKSTGERPVISKSF